MPDLTARSKSRLGIIRHEPVERVESGEVAVEEPRRPGRPANAEPTFPVTVMLTNAQNKTVDTWLVNLNSNARDKNAKHKKAKRNHLFQTFIEAVERSGYDLTRYDSLEALEQDLTRRLKEDG